MTNAVFTFAPGSEYNDQLEIRYHFPATYLRAVEAAVGDWIIYYEPRRRDGPGSSNGRMSYFALARVLRVVPDEAQPDHFYAYVDSYLDFDREVPFRRAGRAYEKKLEKSDGTTNRGAFGRSVRQISRTEFDAILADAFHREFAPWEIEDRVSEPTAPERPIVEQVVRRPFRDAAFRRHVRAAYDNTCAITGLKLTNGGGRPEVQAAHIRPVECDGPDSVRNGLALTATVHWLFDRGLVTVDDDYRVIVCREGLPTEMASLVSAGRRIRDPVRPEFRPHRSYLEWHRTARFKG